MVLLGLLRRWIYLIVINSNKTQTAVINMVVKRMLNKVHLLHVSYVKTHIFRSDR